jgi:hypothetical protein
MTLDSKNRLIRLFVRARLVHVDSSGMKLTLIAREISVEESPEAFLVGAIIRSALAKCRDQSSILLFPISIFLGRMNVRCIHYDNTGSLGGQDR